jgi:hypothetical protein
MNRLSLQNEMNKMEKKIYSAPTISETRLDSEINLVLMSDPSTNTVFGMGMDETNETDGTGISQFMNPLKWFR